MADESKVVTTFVFEAEKQQSVKMSEESQGVVTSIYLNKYVWRQMGSPKRIRMTLESID